MRLLDDFIIIHAAYLLGLAAAFIFYALNNMIADLKFLAHGLFQLLFHAMFLLLNQFPYKHSERYITGFALERP